jgi:tripartite-type tricarboxylate transporter receptor subunit TctC
MREAHVKSIEPTPGASRAPYRSGNHRPGLLLGAAALAASVAFTPAAPAIAAAADTLAGKTVTIYVPVAPGGGYDSYARLVASHIGKYLPGQPTVIVKNMPGAGGVVLDAYLFTSAPKDGTAFAILQDANLFQQLTTNEQLPYDARKFGYLGALEKFVPIVLAWHTTTFHTIDDIKKQSMSVGSDGVGSSTDYFPRILNAFFGTRFNVVRGYNGSAAITLAIERGELDGLASWCYDCMKAQKPDWIAGNKVRVLLQLALEGDPELDTKGVPKVIDLAKTAEEKQAVALAFSGVSIARPFVAPPGLAPERLVMLQDAFEATAKDPGLVEDAAREQYHIRFTGAARMAQVVAAVYATDPAVVQKVRGLMSE